MSLPTINRTDASRLHDGGATLTDIRESDEHAREKIPGARNLPLSKLDEADLAAHHKPIIFHCRSGACTQANAPRIAAKLDAACEAFVVDGGLDAWRKAGLPVAIDRRQPIELQRKVQIGPEVLPSLARCSAFWCRPGSSPCRLSSVLD